MSIYPATQTQAGGRLDCGRWPLGAPRELEPVAETDGRLGAVRDPIRAGRRREIERRTVVDEPAILRAHEETVRDIEIGAAAIDERRARLSAHARSVIGR